jgi:hypothetical protein
MSSVGLWCTAFKFENSCLVLFSAELLCCRQKRWRAVRCAWDLGLPPIFDDNRSCTELPRIFDFKMMKGTSGMVGAVSGVQPNRTLEGTCMQSGRFWTCMSYMRQLLTRYIWPWIWVSIHFFEAGPKLKGIHDDNQVPSCFLVKVRKITTVMLFIFIHYIIAPMVSSADHSCSEALSFLKSNCTQKSKTES